MPNMTLAIPEELKRKMELFKEINWSEVARQAIEEKTIILEKMNQLLSASRLSEPEATVYGTRIKKSVLKKHKKAN